MIETKVILLTSDYDWQALYIDGRLCLEDHRVKTEDALRLVSEKCDKFIFHHYHDCSEYLDVYGSYPDTVGEVLSFIKHNVE